MKKIIFSVLYLIFTCTAFSQKLIGSDNSNKTTLAQLDTMPIMYVHVLLAEKGTNYMAIIDAGDGLQWAIANDGIVVNRFRGFKSPNQLFNFMYDNQWEYVDTIENVSSTGALGQMFLGINTTKTKLVYIFKRRKS